MSIFYTLLIICLFSFLIYLIMENNKKTKKRKRHTSNKNSNKNSLKKQNKKSRNKIERKSKNNQNIINTNPNKKRKRIQSKNNFSDTNNNNNYQIVRQSNKTRQKLLHQCGLPDIPETSHCFNDSTHQTCCEIGPKARDYADSSNNPIGKLADNVFQQLPNNHPKKDYYKRTGRRPWCTCFGSKVCGKYSEMYPNDTQIRFINAPYDNRVIKNIKKHNRQTEENIRKQFNVSSHLTPGV